MELIDREKALKTIKEQRDLAIQREYDTPTNSPCYTRYSAQASERSRFYDFLGTQPTVKAIPLDKVKQAREEIDAQCGSKGLDDYDYCSGLIFAKHVLDKLIAGSEGINDNN